MIGVELGKNSWMGDRQTTRNELRYVAEGEWVTLIKDFTVEIGGPTCPTIVPIRFLGMTVATPSLAGS
jgi:hypothetical protein